MIVTAWSPPDGSLLAGLLGSLAALGARGRPPFRVLVPGAAEADRVRRLAGDVGVQTIVAPFAMDEPSPHDALLPDLPRLTGMSEGVVTWLAPSVWVQEAHAIRVMREAATDGSLVAAYAVDRAYRALTAPRSPWHIHRAAMARAFGAEAARRLWMRPAIDIGVFSLAADAPHWSAWRAIREAAVERGRSPGAGTPHTLGSLALNIAVRTHRLPVLPLPARWNWLCHLERPLWQDGRLVEPEPPHDPIAILHLSGESSRRVMRIEDRDGRRLRSSLRFPLRIEPDAA
ncbi:hypothetical protein STAQ_11440 [Allostella sp. ATCC 35155]|nr:hypothetical protein STAQ_11440 [Stella sp. ATCC 35155]